MTGLPSDNADLLPSDTADAGPRLPSEGRTAHGVWDSLVSGYQSSATGLIARGRLPDVQLDPKDSKWWERLAHTAGQMAPDIPEMAAGTVGGAAAGTAVAGPVGTIIGGGAGAMAVPTAIRQSLIEAYSKGHVVSAADFFSRAAIVAEETGKAAVVGGLTAGAGSLAARGAGALLAPAIGESITAQTAMRAITGASAAGSVAANGAVPAFMQGKLPEPRDFADAAVVVAGMEASGAVASRIATVYAKTGLRPEQVAAAAQADPELARQLKTQDFPDMLRPLAAHQAALDGVPGPDTDPAHTARLEAMVSQPTAEVPLEKEPNHINYNYIDDDLGVNAYLARLSNVFQEQLDTARGKESWGQTKAKAEDMLADWASRTGGAPPKGDFNELAARQMATTQMVQRAAYDMKNAAEAMRNEPTAENIAAFKRTVNTAALVQAVDQGDAAAIARALNARKAASEQRSLLSDYMDISDKFFDDPTRVAEMIGNLKTPEQLSAFANSLLDPSFGQRIGSYYRASLLMGPKVIAVKAAGDVSALISRNLERAVAGLLPGEITVGEAGALTRGMAGGVGDALTAFKAVWTNREARSIDNPSGYTKIFGGAEPGKVAEMANRAMSVTGRGIEAVTAFMRVLNERGELWAQAHREALASGLTAGTDNFNQKVASLINAPTEKMAAAVEQAGKEGTFTKDLGDTGQLIQKWARNHPVASAVIMPFVKVPTNLFKFAVEHTPGAALLLKEVREDLAAGGARRQLSLAKQTVGGAVLAGALAKVAAGTLTGSGAELTSDEKRAKQDSGQWQPNSIKIGDKWYDYSRFEPFSRMVQVAADVHNIMEQHPDSQDAAHLASTIAAVFGHSVESASYMQGMHTLMQAFDEPGKFFPRLWDHTIAGFVPSMLAQAASTNDPVQRRTDGWLDEIKLRLPVLRQQLAAKINPMTGEPLKNPAEGVAFTPEKVLAPSDDPVLREADKIGFSLTRTPQTLRLPSPKGVKGSAPLTPEQQEQYNEIAGKQFHDMAGAMIQGPSWESTPTIVRKEAMEYAMRQARKSAAIQVIPPEQRAAAIEAINDQYMKEIEK